MPLVHDDLQAPSHGWQFSVAIDVHGNHQGRLQLEGQIIAEDIREVKLAVGVPLLRDFYGFLRLVDADPRLGQHAVGGDAEVAADLQEVIVVARVDDRTSSIVDRLRRHHHDVGLMLQHRQEVRAPHAVRGTLGVTDHDALFLAHDLARFNACSGVHVAAAGMLPLALQDPHQGARFQLWKVRRLHILVSAVDVSVGIRLLRLRQHERR
mmetsp:Transcript_22650/g.63153  ORF Transcript_22650/g.63153 Transcript_22650/m.63153 type:complete len:209 (+) Transcript_22650:386-1012(+)